METTSEQAVAVKSYVEIEQSLLQSYPLSLATLLGEQMKIVVLRNMNEPRILKRAILSAIGQRYGSGFEAAAAGFLNNLEVPSPEVVGALVHVANTLRESKYISILFSDLIVQGGFPEPVAIDGSILRFYFPQHYAALRSRRDLFQRMDFMSVDPHDEAGTSVCANLPVGPHRDVDVPMASLPINIWFPLQSIPKWRSLLFFPTVLKQKLISFPSGLNERDPATWGYGEPLQFELKVGDILLFHCEHFHSTPWSDNEPRLSGEVRIAASCPDDHSTYRRTFANLNNFKPKRPGKPGRAYDAADLLFKEIDWSPRRPRIRPFDVSAEGSAFAVLAACFDDVEDARRSLCTFEPDNIFLKQSVTLERVRTAFASLRNWEPFAEDRLIASCRLLQAKGDPEGGKRALRALLAQTVVYFWALECGRYALRYGYLDIAEAAFLRVIELAKTSTVRVFQSYPPLPTTDVCRHLLPEDAITTATSLLSYLKDRKMVVDPVVGRDQSKSFLTKFRRLFENQRGALVAQGQFLPPLDAILFQPNVRVHTLEPNFHGYGLFACAAFKTFVAIPSNDGFFDPTLAKKNQYGEILHGDSEQELIDKIWVKIGSDLSRFVQSGKPKESSGLERVDHSSMCDIFSWEGKFVAAPKGRLSTQESVLSAVALGEAVVAKTIFDVRASARELQAQFWPVEDHFSPMM